MSGYEELRDEAVDVLHELRVEAAASSDYLTMARLLEDAAYMARAVEHADRLTDNGRLLDAVVDGGAVVAAGSVLQHALDIVRRG